MGKGRAFITETGLDYADLHSPHLVYINGHKYIDWIFGYLYWIYYYGCYFEQSTDR